jgi:PAS domain-containing protein
MTEGQHKNLALILSRQLAANLATAMYLIDAEGMLVYYNEPAAELIGKSFEELGEITAAKWGEMLQLRDLNGERLSRRNTPAGIAFRYRRPDHQVLNVTSLNGIQRRTAVTAYPLFSRDDDFAGVVIIVWENGSAGKKGS